MNKPLLALAGIGLLATAAAAATLVFATSDNDDQAVRRLETPTPTLHSCDPRATPPDKQLWRWMDLVVLLPKQGFDAHPEFIPPELKPPNGGPGLMTGKYPTGEGRVGASLLIDAETGAIVYTGGGPEHGKATGIAICPFDPTAAPWPYNGDPPVVPRDPTQALVSKWAYTPPDPGSGMYAEYSIGAAGCSAACPWVECQLLFESVSVRNGRSQAFIGMDSVSGAVCKDLSNVDPDDLAAFQRFLDRTGQCMLGNAQCQDAS